MPKPLRVPHGPRIYHFPNGSSLSIGYPECHVIPAWCSHISRPISRQEAAKALIKLRKIERESA